MMDSRRKWRKETKTDPNWKTRRRWTILFWVAVRSTARPLKYWGVLVHFYCCPEKFNERASVCVGGGGETGGKTSMRFSLFLFFPLYLLPSFRPSFLPSLLPSFLPPLSPSLPFLLFLSLLFSFFQFPSFAEVLQWSHWCVDLTGVRVTEVGGERWSLGVSVGVFCEEITSFNRQCKDICRHQCKQASFNALGLSEMKRQKKGKFFLFSWVAMAVFTCPQTSQLWFRGWFSGLWARLNDTTGLPGSAACRQ